MYLLKTKEDLVNILAVSPDKVCVIPHGYSKHVGEFPASDISPASHYILYVGQRYAYKNFIPFIRECAKVMHDYPELEVVCTGPNFTIEEQKLFDRLHIGNKVKHVFANEGELHGFIVMLLLSSIPHYTKDSVFPFWKHSQTAAPSC